MWSAGDANGGARGHAERGHAGDVNAREGRRLTPAGPSTPAGRRERERARARGARRHAGDVNAREGRRPTPAAPSTPRGRRRSRGRCELGREGGQAAEPERLAQPRARRARVGGALRDARERGGGGGRVASGEPGLA